MQAPGQTQQAPGAPGRGEAGAGRGAAGQAGPGGAAARAGAGRAPALPIPPEFDAGPIWKLDQPKLIAILKDSNSTLFQKAIACKKLAQIGTRESIQPLAALLGEQRLGHYARFGLEPNPDPAVDDALRAALPKLKGRLLMGVIHSIGVRRDAKALDALGKLMNDSDVEIAQAASASVGTIGGLQASKLLQAALKSARPPVLPVVARAALVCADGLMASNRAQALEMYNILSGATMPRVVHLAAIRTLNATLPAPAANPA